MDPKPRTAPLAASRIPGPGAPLKVDAGQPGFEVLDWSAQEIRRQVELRSVLYENLVRRGNISLD